MILKWHKSSLSNINSLVLGQDFCPLIWHGARFLVKFGHLNSLITVVTLRNFHPHRKFLIVSRCPGSRGRLSLVSFKLFNNTWDPSNPRFYPRPSRHCCAELFSGAHEFFSSLSSSVVRFIHDVTIYFLFKAESWALLMMWECISSPFT